MQTSARMKAYVRTQDGGNGRLEGHGRAKSVVHNAQSVVLSLEELLRDGTDLQQHKVNLYVECTNTISLSCVSGHLQNVNCFQVMSKSLAPNSQINVLVLPFGAP